MADFGRSLVWFRRDLRASDHSALAAAMSQSSRGVIGLFVVDAAFWKQHHEAGVKIDFWLRNLAALKHRLETLGVPLKLIDTTSAPALPEAIVALARRLECDTLHFHREYEVNEVARDRAVRAHCLEAGIKVCAYHDRVILPPGSLRTGAGTPYGVFTPFRCAWEKLVAHTLDRVLPEPVAQPNLGIASDALPDAVIGFASHVPLESAYTLYPAGEAAAHARLQRFIRTAAPAYVDGRNVPSHAGTSGLSPYLAAGVLSPRQCLEAASRASNGRPFTTEGISTWISELCWREFYTHLLCDYPRLSRGRPFKLATEAIEWRTSESDFIAWCEGKTGFPIVDSAMRAFNSTGFMHNRLRMIVAMFLTKDLLIDWRRGEQFFMKHLIDGDLAANNGGWQWSASTGTDAQPYFRIFNPTTQSETYDPKGKFIRQWLPELAHLDDKTLHDPHVRGAHLSVTTYPRPIVNHAKARLRAIATFKAIK